MKTKERIKSLLSVAESMVGTAPNEIEEARIDGQIRAYREVLFQFDNEINNIEFLSELDPVLLQALLLSFLDVGEDNVDISTLGDFETQFVEYAKESLTYAPEVL